MKTVLISIVTSAIIFGIWLQVWPPTKTLVPVPTPQTPAPKSQSLGDTLPIGGSTYNLSGSGVSSSATSLTLASLTLTQSGQKIRTSDLSSPFYITLEPGNRTRQEFVSCTTVSQNASTATLSGCVRGLSPITPYTASSTLQFSHAGGTQVIFSDPPQHFNAYYALANVSTSTNILWFSSTTPPRLDSTAAQHNGTYIASTSEFASIDYVNNTVLSGAANGTESVKGISEFATALEQASSTILGSTAAGLVMQARYATDTPTIGCAAGYTATAGAGCSVVAALTGLISQTFIGLSRAWLWLGVHNFAGSATYVKNLNASSTAANPMVLNGISLSTPNTQGASSTVLANNGSGVLTWQAPGTVLCASAGQVAGSVNATTSLATCVVPANTINTTNAILKIHALWDTDQSQSSCTATSISWGNGTATDTPLSIFNQTSANAGDMQVTIVATSTNAALAMGISVSKSGVNNGNVMNPGIAESTHYAST